MNDNTNPGICTIDELYVKNASGTDYAAHKNCTSATYIKSSQSYPPSGATDRMAPINATNFVNMWASSNSLGNLPNEKEWLTVDLGDIYEDISNIQVDTYYGHGFGNLKSYKILASIEGIRWFEVTSMMNNTNGMTSETTRQDIFDISSFVNTITESIIKNNVRDMQTGDFIPCRYTALTSGQVGIFSELGTCTTPEIPVTGTATPDGKFYLIMTGYDSQGRKKLVADRNIQTGISWDTLNSAGICSGLSINPRFSPVLSQDDGNVISSGNYGSYYPYKVFDGVLDVNNEWTAYPNFPAYIGYKFNTAHCIKRYSLSADSYSNMTNLPKSWILQGRNSDTDTWEDIHSVTNETLYANGETRTYLCPDNTKSYTQYRLYITSHQGGTYISICELALYGEDSFLVKLMTGGISSTDKDNEWDKIIVESSLGGTITPGDDNVWHWKGIRTRTSTTYYNGNTYRVDRGQDLVTTYDYNGSSTLTPNLGFRPVMIVEDTSAPVVTVTKFMLQQGTNIFDINPANYSTPPTNISELHEVESLTDAIIEQSGGGWDDVVNYLSLFKGTKYKILKFIHT